MTNIFTTSRQDSYDVVAKRGMSNSITDSAAIAFCIGFNHALGSGEPFKTAYHFGCIQIGLQNGSDYDVPIIKIRQTV